MGSAEYKPGVVTLRGFNSISTQSLFSWAHHSRSRLSFSSSPLHSFLTDRSQSPLESRDGTVSFPFSLFSFTRFFSFFFSLFQKTDFYWFELLLFCVRILCYYYYFFLCLYVNLLNFLNYVDFKSSMWETLFRILFAIVKDLKWWWFFFFTIFIF